MLKQIAATAVICVATSGCAAVLVGGLFYNSSKTYEQKQKYTADFNQQNLEREKAGLAKLDWCSETYKFDKAWASETGGCAERIRKYEAGDKDALTV